MRRCVSWVLAGCGLLLVVASAATAQAPRTTRVSVAAGGGQANAQSTWCALSSDGRYVAFDSSASNLVTDDANGAFDVFVHDRWTGATTRVSLAPGGGEADGGSGGPSLSADGRYVAFPSNASNLVADDTNGLVDVFVLDRHAGTTTRVSVSTGGGQANGIVLLSTISADGHDVAFTSEASNLVPGDTNGHSDVFLHDRQTATTTRVSVATGGGQANDSSYHCALSADGRYVAFESDASNLVADDTNQERDIFVHDRQTGTTTRVSIATGGGQANSGSYSFAFSLDGRYVAFDSDANNLVAGDTNGHSDVFLHDRQTLTTTRVSVATGGEQANGEVGGPALSADGRYVAFTSSATNLVLGDTNATWDVFVHDRQTGNTTRISVATSGAQASNGSNFPAFAANGRYVAFISEASNLVPGDTNGAADVFVRDRGSWPRDFEGDRATDATVFRPSTGVWYQLRSSGGYGVGWGLDGDKPAPGDYDGDGITDPAVFRPSSGTWYILQSTTGTGVGVQWGVADDVPVPADYDADGKTDVAVWRRATGVWYIILSTTNNAVGISWGLTGDVPVPADFDGDGHAEPTVFRPSTGTWYQLRRGGGYGVVWGQVGDMPLAGDFDGDGTADPTVFRASTGTWYELRSTTGAGFGVLWGTVDDVPIVGDHDGDGKMDPTVFRPSTNTWYQLRSTTGAGWGVVWGAAGDLPQ